MITIQFEKKKFDTIWRRIKLLNFTVNINENLYELRFSNRNFCYWEVLWTQYIKEYFLQNCKDESIILLLNSVCPKIPNFVIARRFLPKQSPHKTAEIASSPKTLLAMTVPAALIYCYHAMQSSMNLFYLNKAYFL